MDKEEIQRFLLLFPDLPNILEQSRQAAIAELKRREVVRRIEKIMKEKAAKISEEGNEEEREDFSEIIEACIKC